MKINTPNSLGKQFVGVYVVLSWVDGQVSGRSHPPEVWFQADGQPVFFYYGEGLWHYFGNTGAHNQDSAEKEIKDKMQFKRGKRPALVADANARISR